MSSPSVTTTTTNRPTYIPSLTNEVAMFVGHFERGPIDIPVFITNIDDFKFIFGAGVDDHFNDFFQVYNYLQYSSGLYVVRTSGFTKINANNGDDVYVNSYEDWESQKDNIITDNIRFIAQTAGNWGNLLKISVITETSWNNNVNITSTLSAKQAFEFFEEGHLGVCIFRNGVLVEKFYKSYFNIDEINEESAYVYTKVNDNLLGYDELDELTDFVDSDGVLDFGGFNTNDAREILSYIDSTITYNIDLGDTLQTFDEYIDENYSFYDSEIIDFQNGFNEFPTDIDFENTYAIMSNKDEYDIDIVIGNERANHIAVDFVEQRKDCIAFIGIPTSFITYLKLLMGEDENQRTAYTNSGLVIATNEIKMPPKLSGSIVQKLNDYINSIPQSQFVHFTLNIKVQLDLFTNKYRLVNIAGDTAGLKAQASLISPWTPNAGLEKGRIKGAKKMYINLSDTQTTNYYKKGLNFIQNNVLMSQKTYYNKRSSFNRINVRSLFNHLERETKKILDYYIFEENTLRIRQNVASKVRRYLEDVQVNKGIEAAQVQVFPSDVNPNEIIVEVAVKPTYVAETINIRITNAGTNQLTDIVS